MSQKQVVLIAGGLTAAGHAAAAAFARAGANIVASGRKTSREAA